jgi:hypothetical protein
MTTDLFGEPTLEGVLVELDRGCAWCGNATLVISGPGAGPHAARLACPNCHRGGGWLRREAAAFLTEIVKAYGRPTQPVIVRNHPIERDSRSARRVSNARKQKDETNER